MAMLPPPTSAVQTAPGLLEQAPAPGQRARRGSQGLARLVRAVRSNRKATAGTVLLVLFFLVALFPGVIAHDSPTATIYPRSLGPSARHLLGTTALGQDIFAQTVYGTQQVLIIAIGVGLLSTGVAVLIGVAPGVSVSSCEMFRPFKGKSLIGFSAITVPSSDEVLCISSAAVALTSMVSETAPMVKTTSWVRLWFTPSSISFFAEGRNPSL
jgi:hypothetical protein